MCITCRNIENVDKTYPEVVHGDSKGVHHLSINGLILQVNQIHLLTDLKLHCQIKGSQSQQFIEIQ